MRNPCNEYSMFSLGLAGPGFGRRGDHCYRPPVLDSDIVSNCDQQSTDEESERWPTTKRTAPTAVHFFQAGALRDGLGREFGARRWRPRKLVARTPVLPKRKLGKTGVEISMLEAGAVRSDDRVLRIAFANGIRIFDTAKVYGTEPNFKKWFEQDPKVRKEIFLVTKDMPRTPKDMLKMVDERLAALGTDYIDLFFIHGLGDQRTRRRIDQHGHEPGIQGNGRCDPQVGQGQVHRLLEPQQGPRPDHRGGGQGGISSTRSCSSTGPGSKRTRRSTRHSTSAGRRGSA